MSDTGNKMMTVNELCEWLRISRAGTYRTLLREGLPFVAICGKKRTRRRFHQETVLAWLEKRSKKK